MEGSEAARRVALELERRLVLALGGFALEIPGAVLVTHEKLPAPRFNFAVVGEVARERQAAFFERALDHYFQRALRPTFRVPTPAPDHVRSGLEKFGFRATPEPHEVMVASGTVPPVDRPVEVRPAEPDESELVASFWAEEKHRPELRTALEIAVHHPSPSERLVPLLARVDGVPAAAALVYRLSREAGIYLVATRSEARGHGAATALVAFARDREPAGPADRYSILAESPRGREHLRTLGFRTVGTYEEFRLPADAELSLPPAGPPSPPRWRPPR